MEIELWGRSGSPPETNVLLRCVYDPPKKIKVSQPRISHAWQSPNETCRLLRQQYTDPTNVELIRNSGARYLFGIAHNQAQRVGKNEGKARSEKETLPPASRFHSPLHGGVLSHITQLVR
jgi:hypothetical protein